MAQAYYTVEEELSCCTIAKLVHTDEAMLTFECIGCDQQTINRDCGLISIAKATELAFKGDPGTVRYANGEILRFHLIECLKNRFS